MAFISSILFLNTTKAKIKSEYNEYPWTNPVCSDLTIFFWNDTSYIHINILQCYIHTVKKMAEGYIQWHFYPLSSSMLLKRKWSLNMCRQKADLILQNTFTTDFLKVAQCINSHTVLVATERRANQWIGVTKQNYTNHVATFWILKVKSFAIILYVHWFCMRCWGEVIGFHPQWNL